MFVCCYPSFLSECKWRNEARIQTLSLGHQDDPPRCEGFCTALNFHAVQSQFSLINYFWRLQGTQTQVWIRSKKKTNLKKEQRTPQKSDTRNVTLGG